MRQRINDLKRRIARLQNKSAHTTRQAGTGLDVVKEMFADLQPSRKACQMILEEIYSAFVEGFSSNPDVLHENIIESDFGDYNVSADMDYQVSVPMRDLAIGIVKIFKKADRHPVDLDYVIELLTESGYSRTTMSSLAEIITRRYRSQLLSNEMDIAHYALHNHLDVILDLDEEDEEDLIGPHVEAWRVRSITVLGRLMTFYVGAHVSYDEPSGGYDELGKAHPFDRY